MIKLTVGQSSAKLLINILTIAAGMFFAASTCQAAGGWNLNTGASWTDTDFSGSTTGSWNPNVTGNSVSISGDPCTYAHAYASYDGYDFQQSWWRAWANGAWYWGGAPGNSTPVTITYSGDFNDEGQFLADALATYSGATANAYGWTYLSVSGYDISDSAYVAAGAYAVREEEEDDMDFYWDTYGGTGGGTPNAFTEYLNSGYTAHAHWDNHYVFVDGYSYQTSGGEPSLFYSLFIETFSIATAEAVGASEAEAYTENHVWNPYIGGSASVSIVLTF